MFLLSVDFNNSLFGYWRRCKCVNWPNY